MEHVRLVLLPGLDGTGILFKPLIEKLPEFLEPQVVRYPCDWPLTYEQALEIVLEALPEDQPFALLGESFSGPLAVMAAGSAQSNLKALILCASFITNPLPWIPIHARHMLFPWMFCAAPWIARLKTLLPERSDPELVPLLLEANSIVAPAVWCARIKALLQVDVIEKLSTCAVPLMYLQACRDWVVPSRNARQILKHRPDARLVSIDSGHLILQTHPAEAAGAIADFLREVASA